MKLAHLKALASMLSRCIRVVFKPLWAPRLRLLDVIHLVESNGADPYAFIVKVAEWEHQRRLEFGKWLLATAAGALIALFTLLGKDTSPPHFTILILESGAAVAFTTGLFTMFWAGSAAARTSRLSVFAARLVAIRPFLELLRREGKL